MNEPFQLFTRSGTDKWQVRFSVQGHGQIKKSTGATDQELARKQAWSIWHKAQAQAATGQSIRSRKFTAVLDEFIAWTKIKVENGEMKPYRLAAVQSFSDRYFKPFFATKAIESIRKSEIDGFLDWAKAYWITGPGAKIEHIEYRRKNKRAIQRKVQRKRLADNTLNTLLVELNRIFRFALERGFITVHEVPHPSEKKRKDRPRASFTDAEIEILLVHLGKHAGEDAFRNKGYRSDRLKLLAFVGLAINSGMRPGDLLRLEWGDVHNFNLDPELDPKAVLNQATLEIETDAKAPARHLIVYAQAKNHPRETIPRGQFRDYLRSLRDQFIQEVGRIPNPDDPVFFHPNGKRLLSFSNGLHRALVACGLKKNRLGQPRSAYSMRHYYVTKALEEGWDIHLIARNCGTSVAMIERFYSKFDVRSAANQLANEKNTVPFDPLAANAHWITPLD